jgi:transposase
MMETRDATIPSEVLYESLDKDNVIEAASLDKGYDADRIRERLLMDGIEPVIPPICTRSKKLYYDKLRYKGRNRIERFFNKLKQFRRIATRYDKLARSFFSAVCIASAFITAKNSSKGSSSKGSVLVFDTNSQPRLKGRSLSLTLTHNRRVGIGLPLNASGLCFC